MPYIYNLVTKGPDNGTDPKDTVLTTNPICVVAVWPFKYPSTFAFRYSDRARSYQKEGDKPRMTRAEAMDTLPPVILDPWVTDVNVVSSKRNHIAGCAVELIDPDVIGTASINPSDWIMVWMLNERERAADLRDRIRQGSACNEFDSGLKFVGKIQAVRQHVSVEPMTGRMVRRVSLTSQAYTELDTVIYFDYLTTPNDESNYLFTYRLLNGYAAVNTTVGLQRTPQESLIFFYNLFCNTGMPEMVRWAGSFTSSPNELMHIPSAIGNVLSIKNDAAKGLPFAAMMVQLWGVQSFIQNPSSPAQGFLPQAEGTVVQSKIDKDVPSFVTTGTPLRGQILDYLMPWANTPIWQIMTGSALDAINEVYTSLHVWYDGRIRPMICGRQTPFTSDLLQTIDEIKGGVIGPLTRFHDLPRWKAEAIQVISVDLSRSNILHRNWVQTRVMDTIPSPYDLVNQRESNHPIANSVDIWRNGLYPSIPQTRSMWAGAVSTKDSPNEFAKIIADRDMDGHLKLSGTITLKGIEEPICEGDNFEFDNIVFHIEQVTHAYKCNPMTGGASFNTTLALSNGVPAQKGDRLFVGTNMKGVPADSTVRILPFTPMTEKVS